MSGEFEKPEEAPVRMDPPLVHKKLQVVAVAALLAAPFIYDSGVKQLGWTPFMAVGLAINAGFVFAVLLHSFPLVIVGISMFLLLMASFVGDIGYWLSVIAVVVYFLTAFRPMKKAEPGVRR
ncbi:MAG: hypothetical protein A3G18_01150 [Rhodospirillales bacterium RIFCSPLOWO2_12_FULL_58_28]|nr:MAG: hypothetical protein A3H92_04350 [Rhodospirillales bacterium RIFCSPLOWO2_02_FULL_58_16]OHC78010.1 MAG: hypothetical protein A3G18_01150 [Rhodospirillales bacterium RIFCSPLOWO2_12_FULL_58_28]